MKDCGIVVFVSHVHEDETIASALKEYLERLFLNATVFVSGQDLAGGELWAEELRKKLQSSTAIIAIITRFSRDSRAARTVRRRRASASRCGNRFPREGERRTSEDLSETRTATGGERREADDYSP